VTSTFALRSEEKRLLQKEFHVPRFGAAAHFTLAFPPSLKINHAGHAKSQRSKERSDWSTPSEIKKWREWVIFLTTQKRERRMIGTTTTLLLIASLATAAEAFEAANTLVASSPFELYLQPTFIELNLEAQTIAASSVADILSSANSDLEDIDVVIQNSIFHPRRRRLNFNTSLNLPSTTLTFAVLGTFPDDMNGQRDFLNTLIQDTFSSNAGRAELLQTLKASHVHFKDLIDLQVSSTSMPTTSTESSTKSFFESLSLVDIVLVAVSVCVLLGVTYMVIMSHRANRREHERVLRLLSTHAAAASSLRELEQEENASISSRLQLLKSSMRRSSSMTITNLPAKATEEEEATDEEDRGSSKEADEVEPIPSLPSQKSSSSYHSAKELLASSRELVSNKSMRSEGIVSEQDVIPSPQSSTDEEDYTESEGGYSSGVSSAHFSSSRWFQGNNVPTPSEDTFDVFAIDVDKYDESLLLDDASKTSGTSNFLEEWVKAIQVVPTEKSSVATPDSASTPECASIESGESHEGEVEKETESVTHQTAPEKSEAATMDESVTVVMERSTRGVEV
jgi:hypothetical protein